MKEGEFPQYRNDIRERTSYHHNLIEEVEYLRPRFASDRQEPIGWLHRKAVKRPINFRRIDRTHYG